MYIRFPIRREVSQQPAPQRAPVLERLLAQAAPPLPAADWRTDAYRVISARGAPMPAIAPVALVAARGNSAAAFTCVATPLQLLATMTSVTLPADGLLILDAPAAARLAGDFNRQFGDSGTTLTVGRGALLLCELDRTLEVSTHDPQRLLGHDVFDSQPAGTDGGTMRRLMSEVEMWLFEHELNRERVARGLPPVSSLWLWGGGVPLAELPAVQGWTAGADPLFSAFGAAQEFPGDARSGVLVTAECPGEPAWADVERRWLQPALAALRARRIERIELSVGAQRLSVGPARWWTAWRRVRPWWEALEEIHEHP